MNIKQHTYVLKSIAKKFSEKFYMDSYTTMRPDIVIALLAIKCQLPFTINSLKRQK